MENDSRWTGVIETGYSSTYIPDAMKTRMTFALLVLPALLTLPSSGAADEAFTLDFLLTLDREVSGLLDAYLEAIPECPVSMDTPLRLWVLDAAWLRTRAVLDHAASVLPGDDPPVFPMESWEAYLARSEGYLDVFRSIQVSYHEEPIPDSIHSVEMELRILEADSVWRNAEQELFTRLAEEGFHE